MSDAAAGGATTKMNALQAVNAAIADAMENDPKVILLGEDVADREGGGVSRHDPRLSTRFGDDRVKSTPISEQAIIGAAIGAALAAISRSPKSC
jgi:pyruvate/2-oxoglutarate/acetoin dehydrogenase E1 component